MTRRPTEPTRIERTWLEIIGRRAGTRAVRITKPGSIRPPKNVEAVVDGHAPAATRRGE
jgi:hypothetical protein